MSESRLALLQKKLLPQQALLLTDPHDITYFSGFQTLVPEEREAYLVVTKAQAYLLYASFSPLPEPLEVIGLVGVYPGQVVKHLKFITQKTAITELLIDKTRMFVLEYESVLAGCDLQVSTLNKKMLWDVRMVKDGVEVDAIKAASKVAVQAFEALMPFIQEGVTEREVQLKLEDLMRGLGSYQTAFPTIVAFGPHSALPHHQPSDMKLTANMAVLLDFGATVDGYRSDMTRSFWFGNAVDSEYAKIKTIVDDAYQAVKKLPREPKVTAGDLDRAARDLITKAGFGEQYIHTTGHGVGLDIHEPPSLSSRNEQEIVPNMVITVEPGIYLPGKFGYRYENTVLVTERELVELTIA